MMNPYLAGVRFRHWLYDRKILPKKFAPIPVVSIGNLVTGGAGKTQAALMLAKELSEYMPVAILSRGYRSHTEHVKNPVLIDIQKHSVQRVGDEPWLLASRLMSEKACVIVNKRRFKSTLLAKQWGAHLVILDDGMQHRSLHRDFEIVVIDGQSSWGSFLPRGNLREDPARLKEADLIVFVGHPESSIKDAVSKYTDASHVIANIVTEGVFDLQASASISLQGVKVGVFCGIGNPARFVKTVERLGAEVVGTLFSSDHKVPRVQKLLSFASLAKSKGASFLVCTEKDRVKLCQTQYSLPICWVKVSLKITQNQEAWQQLVNEMKLSVGKAA